MNYKRGFVFLFFILLFSNCVLADTVVKQTFTEKSIELLAEDMGISSGWNWPLKIFLGVNIPSNIHYFVVTIAVWIMFAFILFNISEIFFHKIYYRISCVFTLIVIISITGFVSLVGDFFLLISSFFFDVGNQNSFWDLLFVIFLCVILLFLVWVIIHSIKRKFKSTIFGGDDSINLAEQEKHLRPDVFKTHHNPVSVMRNEAPMVNVD
ncbi:MAG: hypothetical protein KKF56_02570 [Nanoarchaeota archaeon]|nr:hypothetical protein [Nanoarchaeota archaeon]